MSKFLQGKFEPKNPKKYKGNLSNIFFRSSWERKFMIWCDSNKNVIEWSSEEVVIPYVYSLDNKAHRYFVDFYIKVKDNQGNIKKYLVEIKPKCQTIMPKRPKRETQKSKLRYIEEVKTYYKNKDKWAAAKRISEENGMGFLVMTEDDLGIKK